MFPAARHPHDSYPIYMMFEVIHVYRKTAADRKEEEQMRERQMEMLCRARLGEAAPNDLPATSKTADGRTLQRALPSSSAGSLRPEAGLGPGKGQKEQSTVSSPRTGSEQASLRRPVMPEAVNAIPGIVGFESRPSLPPQYAIDGAADGSSRVPAGMQLGLAGDAAEKFAYRSPCRDGDIAVIPELESEQSRASAHDRGGQASPPVKQFELSGSPSDEKQHTGPHSGLDEAQKPQMDVQDRSGALTLRIQGQQQQEEGPGLGPQQNFTAMIRDVRVVDEDDRHDEVGGARKRKDPSKAGPRKDGQGKAEPLPLKQ